jgi:hypothetical protein
MTCVYVFKPSPDTTTVEGLDTWVTYIINASLYFTGFLIWFFSSVIDYNEKRIELLDKKAEKYDALCENVSALNEANRIDREHMRLIEQRINQIKYDKENPV